MIGAIFDDFLKKCDMNAISVDKRQLIEYTYMANMINVLIVYGHGGKKDRMRDKYQFFMEDVQKKFPEYEKNPYFGLFKPKGQSTKIRLAVGLVMRLKKMHLDKLFFMWFPIYRLR